MLKIFKSFKFAFRGLLYCIKYERNFRIHLSVMYLVLVFAFMYGLDGKGFATLFSAFSLVLFAEAVNTSIETLIDLNSSFFNACAKNAKDIAAGAVLITSIFAICTGVSLFNDIKRILTALSLFGTYPVLWVFLAVSIVLIIIFVKGKRLK